MLLGSLTSLTLDCVTATNTFVLPCNPKVSQLPDALLQNQISDPAYDEEGFVKILRSEHDELTSTVQRYRNGRTTAYFHHLGTDMT